MTEKLCRLCGKVKLLGEFYKNSAAADGRVAYCKPCWKEYRKEYNAAYQGTPVHAEYRLSYERARYSTAEGRKYKLAQNQAWRSRNPQANSWNTYRMAYRAIRRVNETKAFVEKVDRRVVWGRDEGHCRVKLVCGGVFVPFEEMHLDHIVPVAKGGEHAYNNVQTACGPCNLKKGARIMEEVR